jgi:hypothetical protein
MAGPAGPSATRAEVLVSLAAASTQELAEKLLEEYDQINERFHLADYRPSELSGGRFSEAAFRICQHACTGKHTPLGKTLPKVDQLLKDLEQTPASQADDSYRVHIPRALRPIYDFRNKRDVAHLGAGVSPNFTDASLVVGVASWVVAEIVRLGHKCDIATAQRIVDGLVQRRVPLLWAEGDIVRVLKPALSPSDKTLVILYRFHPEWVSDKDLSRWLDYNNITNYRKRVLDVLHRKALIHHTGDRSKILPPGMKYVEDSPDLKTL